MASSHRQRRTGGSSERRAARAGLTLWELLAIVVVLAIIAAVLLPSFGHTRPRGARNVKSIANMKQLATGAASYAADHADLLPGYSWRAGETRSVVGELAPVTFATDREAAAWQLTEILRRSSGRGVPGNDPDADSAGVFIRHDDRILAPARMSHVPLLDYLTDVQPEPIAASPMDRNLLRWQGDPVATLDGVPYA
ncbi:MAG: type II secretion system protein, partial [Planctomycetota bacterium]